MSDIDWSKAPADATHYSPPQGVFIGLWAKQIDGVWYYHRNDYEGWYYGAQPRKDENYIARPAWPGTGLPPVGTVCEIKHPDLGWVKCEIVAHKYFDCGSKPHAIAWIDENTMDQSQGNRLRPIRTPEQIAAEEREKGVAEMMNFRQSFDSAEEFARNLYEAGYRKTEAP